MPASDERTYEVLIRESEKVLKDAAAYPEEASLSTETAATVGKQELTSLQIRRREALCPRSPTELLQEEQRQLAHRSVAKPGLCPVPRWGK